MPKAVQHEACFQQFPTADDCLVIGGVALPQLADRVGSTPFYAYDRSKITERLAQLREAMPSDLHIHYAVKANPMPALVSHVLAHVDGLDVASAGELAVALDCGCVELYGVLAASSALQGASCSSMSRRL